MGSQPAYSIEMNDGRFDVGAINLPTPLRAYLSPRSDRVELASKPHMIPLGAKDVSNPGFKKKYTFTQFYL